MIRAFSLDVAVDSGEILGISDYFIGESNPETQGYGIFPASFRDHISVDPGTGEVEDWNVPEYNPLAVVADAPASTLPGLGSSGVTLELGGLWNPTTPTAAPSSSGMLCKLTLSEAATVSPTVNSIRGGVLLASTGLPIEPILVPAYVDPAIGSGGVITDANIAGDSITISFEDGELETAPTIDGQWTPTGDSSGSYTDTLENTDSKYYRTRQ